MGWHISTLVNTLVVPENVRDEFIRIAEDNGQYIGICEDGIISFDDDSMEHADFFSNDDWAEELLAGTTANGQVIWTAVEGDDAGQFWGHRFSDGIYQRLDTVECLRVILELEQAKTA